MIIPYQQLSADALDAVIEDWLSRQSQELLAVSNNKQDLMDDVKRQLVSKYLVLTWDDESQTINILERQTAEQSVNQHWPESGDVI